VIDAGTLDRTVKLELDTGRALSLADANALTRSYVLQIVVGNDVAGSPTRQAMLLTAINTGVRAFKGGVVVAGDLSWRTGDSWGRQQPASDVVRQFGARIDNTLSPTRATVVIGSVVEPLAGSVRLHPTWERWSAGVATSDSGRRLEQAEFELAGVLAAAMAVSEAFAHTRGSVTAGRREVGLSLWRPDLAWRDAAAAGPPLEFLPTRLWCAGLGHLGQAYLWALGFLPYRDRSEVRIWLQDFDTIEPANRSTGMLVRDTTRVGLLKTRLAAESLEALGFDTRLVERSFDDSLVTRGDEPTWALAGFDNPDARRSLDVFQFAVDVGLGSTADDFLGLHLHTFPAVGAPKSIFSPTTAAGSPKQPSAWAQASGVDACGVVQLDNIAVGAAFVGAAAAALAISEILRALAGADPIAVLSWTLATPQFVDVDYAAAAPLRNPGYQSCT